MDIVIRLERDQVALKQLIEDVKSEYSSPEGKFSSFQRLARLADSNAKAKEVTALAFARNCSSTRPLALAILEKHSVMDELANKIRQTENDEAWEAKVKVYCDFLEQHLEEEEFELLPELSSHLSKEKSLELGSEYLKIRGLCLGAAHGTEAELQKDLSHLFSNLIASLPAVSNFIPAQLNPAMNEAGRIGYIFAWLLGVPAWVLFIIFLVRGH
jgi:hypothetical protein